MATTRNWKPVAFVTLCVVTAVAWAPFFSVLVAGLTATAFGCTLNEGNAHPCVVAGIDLGDTLYAMGVMGWLMLVTVPFMLLTLVVWAALAIVFISRRIQARRAQA